MIVFTFMQKELDGFGSYTGAYLVTNIFNTEEELLNKWLGYYDEEEDEGDGFMSYGLVDDETGERVTEDKMKDILLGKYDDIEFQTETQYESYTFSVVNTEK